jgi:hypothetical protein
VYGRLSPIRTGYAEFAAGRAEKGTRLPPKLLQVCRDPRARFQIFMFPFARFVLWRFSVFRFQKILSLPKFAKCKNDRAAIVARLPKTIRRK